MTPLVQTLFLSRDKGINICKKPFTSYKIKPLYYDKTIINHSKDLRTWSSLYPLYRSDLHSPSFISNSLICWDYEKICSLIIHKLLYFTFYLYLYCTTFLKILYYDTVNFTKIDYRNSPETLQLHWMGFCNYEQSLNSAWTINVMIT